MKATARSHVALLSVTTLKADCAECVKHLENTFFPKLLNSHLCLAIGPQLHLSFVFKAMGAHNELLVGTTHTSSKIIYPLDKSLLVVVCMNARLP